MANIIISSDIVTVADANVSSRTETSGYSDEHINYHWDLKRRFRAQDVNTNDWLLKIDFGAAQNVLGLLISDVNFDTVAIQGHATDSWGTPSYDGDDLTIGMNPYTGRYQIFILPAAFNYRWMRIFIPTGTSVVGDGSDTEWEVGNVVVLSTATAFTKNMAYGYDQRVKYFYAEAVNERYATGSAKRWEAKLTFGNRLLASAAELRTMNRIEASTPFVYYENRSNSYEGYLCVKDNSLTISEFDYKSVNGGALNIREIYKLGVR